jgi:hypothetical protein
MKINKIPNKKYLIVLIGVSVLFIIFFNLYNPENKKLNNFSVAYSNYQKIEGASLNNSVIIMMISGDFPECTNNVLCGENTFYPLFGKALDFSTTPTSRVKSAQSAISFYDSTAKEVLDNFNQHNNELKEKSLKLVEVANSLKEGEPRDVALKIAKESTSLRESYEKAYYTYNSIFSSRLAVLNYLVKHGGTILNSDFNEFKEESTAIKLKYSEVGDIYGDVNKNRKDTEEDFSAFKGKTGVKEY